MGPRHFIPMIRINSYIAIEEDDLRWDFVRSGGPGGQNVNKVATAVQLRFDVTGCASLPLEIKERLKRIAGKRMTTEGVLIIKAQRFRSQERNRTDALERLQEIIAAGCQQTQAQDQNTAQRIIADSAPGIEAQDGCKKGDAA